MLLLVGPRLRGRTATQRSKKGSGKGSGERFWGKVLGERFLGKGSCYGFAAKKEPCYKGSQKGL